MFSCVCPTYCRPERLEEAIESFLRQTYAGPKELVVLNDNPRVHYIFDHPDVRIVNLKTRYHTLGRKLNLGTGYCRYGCRVNWPDDDLFLPHALDTIASGIKEADFYSFSGYWNINKLGELAWVTSQITGIIPIRIEALRWVGGYPVDISCGADKGLRDRIVQFALQGSHAHLTKQQGFFIYRWAPHHLSGYTEQKAWEEIGKIGEMIPEGEFVLKPHWKEDYESRIRRLI